MRFSVSLPMLLAVAFAMPVAAAQEQQQYESASISLSVGQTRSITVPGATRVVEGDPSVAAVQTAGNQIIIRAVGPGQTNVVVFRGNQQISYMVNVMPAGAKASLADVKRLLGDREGIIVNTAGDQVFIEGKAFTAEDYERVVQLTKLYGNVQNLVKLNPNAKKLAANALVETIKRNGMKDVTANVVATTVFLEGSVESQNELHKLELIIKALGEQVENLVTIGIKRMVLMEVQFVEIKRGSLDKIGIKYPTDISGNVTGLYDFMQVWKGDSKAKNQLEILGDFGADFSVGLQFSDGYTRVLAQPKLVCASGEKAEFLAGGEIPIPLITQNTATVEFKKFGVGLTIVPTTDAQGNISTKIEASVSDIDRSLSVQPGGFGTSIPGFRTRTVSTSVTVKHGETIVLSGMFQNDEQKDVSKVPLLGQIPIIGELFKSRNFQDRKTELAVFVTPKIVSPNTPRIRQLIDDIKARYKAAKSEVGYGIFD
ncbi:MAG: pilus assembly protein N-terminal domain-containing protein [Myxococcota bacterium]|jgi:pilus assembly protein CpaC